MYLSINYRNNNMLKKVKIIYIVICLTFDTLVNT